MLSVYKICVFIVACFCFYRHGGHLHVVDIRTLKASPYGQLLEATTMRHQCQHIYSTRPRCTRLQDIGTAFAVSGQLRLGRLRCPCRLLMYIHEFRMKQLTPPQMVCVYLEGIFTSLIT